MTTNTTEQASNKKIGDQIAKCGTLSKKLEKEIQTTLVLVLAHKAEFGDWSGFIRLIEAVSGGVRKNSIRAWVETCTNVEFPRGEKPKMNREKSDMEISAASKISWVNADGKEPDYKPLAWEKQGEKLLAKLQSDIDHGMASLASLEGLIASLQSGLIAKKAAALEVAEAQAQKVA
jgi:hypothetical protein